MKKTYTEVEAFSLWNRPVYRTVHLRETGVAHERAAQKQAERVMLVGGAPRLLVSDAEFKFAMTVQHIEAFQCDGTKIPAGVIDLELVGKLSTHDFGLIEDRVFLITLAAEVRYGNISPEDFDDYLAGRASDKKGVAAPQPLGQIPDVGALGASSESGPALLSDFTGGDAAGASPVDRR